MRFQLFKEIKSSNYYLNEIFLDEKNIDKVDFWYLRSLGSKIFHDFSNLQKINIKFSSFSVKQGIFVGLRNIKKLNMSDIDYMSIEPNGFRELPNLNTLILSSNRLHCIKADTFLGLTNLENLFLDCNEINEIESTAFQG